MAKKKEAEELESLLTEPLPSTSIPKENFLNSGSTELNLACSGKTVGAWAKGLYYLIVGDSDSGKTFLLLTAFAEASINPAFDDYRFILDQPELGAHMDVAGFFGQKMADRMFPPSGDWDDPGHSTTVENFADNVNANLDKGPCIYILDSLDPLETEEEKEFEEEKKRARQKGKKGKKTYGVGKPREISKKLRTLVNRLAENGSILFIVCQTRQNIGYGAIFNPRTRSGGEALRFYARLELWLSIKEKMKHDTHKNWELGQKTKVKIAKNHISGWKGNLTLTLLKGYGLDDVGASIDFLCLHHWKVTKAVIDAVEFEFEGKKEALVEKIQNEGKEKKLRILVGKVWKQIDRDTRIVRKKRYE